MAVSTIKMKMGKITKTMKTLTFIVKNEKSVEKVCFLIAPQRRSLHWFQTRGPVFRVAASVVICD